MAKKPSKALTVLAQNLGRLMDSRQKTQPAIAKQAKIDQKTIWRIVHMTNEPALDKLEKIAGVFDLEAWQLLIPNLDPERLPELAREEATV